MFSKLYLTVETKMITLIWFSLYAEEIFKAIINRERDLKGGEIHAHH